jgi:hypothetical protein
VTVDAAEELRLFLRGRRPRRARVVVDVDRASTLGHVVRSVGIPLTEVGGLPGASSHSRRREDLVEWARGITCGAA